MQLFGIFVYSQSALRASGDVFAHHQEHLTIDSFWYSPLILLPVGVMDEMGLHPISSMTPAGSKISGLYQKLSIQSSAPDDGRKHRPKHVELIGNKQIYQKVASSWSSFTLYFVSSLFLQTVLLKCPPLLQNTSHPTSLPSTYLQVLFDDPHFHSPTEDGSCSVC